MNPEADMEFSLETLFAPLSVETFVKEYLGERYLLCRGAADRWQNLLTWDDLNTALTRLRVAGSRVRLMKDGVPVSRAIYTRDPKDPDGTELIAAAVEEELRDGATLIVDHVHELSPTLTHVTNRLEETFRTVVGANAYIAMGGHMAFGVHWDAHDTLILQIAGRKRWQVHEPTIPHPLASEHKRAASRPSGSPVWEGVLDAGDVLYMPRGWWHAALPDGGYTMHVTFSLEHSTGADLLRWLVGRLKSLDVVRQDLPLLADEETQNAYAARLAKELCTLCTDGVVGRFATFRDSKRPVSGTFRLPPVASAMPTLTGRTGLVLASCRKLYLEPSPDGSRFHFDVRDRRWTCSPTIAPALGRLSHLRPLSLESLSESLTAASTSALRRLVTALLLADVLRTADLPRVEIMEVSGSPQGSFTTSH
jgi:ribosomal protein L16 Arg81 hydroxylase